MAIASGPAALLKNTDCLFLGGEWAEPSTRNKIRVSDSTTEEIFLEVAEAQADDMSRAVGAARAAFDHGPWPRMKHAERAVYLRAIAEYLLTRGEDIGQIWPRETGALQSVARAAGQDGFDIFTYYADQADTFGWVKPMTPTFGGGAGFLIREPVGVVGAIIPWNSPMRLIGYKVAPALIAGCTVVLKASPPEAPAEAYIFAEAVEAAGLPPGVVNVITADREVSELLVRDPRVDKITFTGSTAAGRTIGSICGERVARCTLELGGGKSAAVILNDVDIAKTATHLMRQECLLTGQSCSSLTRVIVPVKRHDEMLEALAAEFRGGACRRPVRAGFPDRAAGVGAPARSGRVLHRQGHRVRRHLGGRRQAARSSAAGGLLHRTDGFWQR